MSLHRDSNVNIQEKCYAYRTHVHLHYSVATVYHLLLQTLPLALHVNLDQQQGNHVPNLAHSGLFYTNSSNLSPLQGD